MILLKVRAVPNAKTEKIEESEDGIKVRVRQPAVDGKANEAVIEAVSKHLGVRKSKVRIARGQKSRDKIIEIDD